MIKQTLISALLVAFLGGSASCSGPEVREALGPPMKPVVLTPPPGLTSESNKARKDDKELSLEEQVKLFEQEKYTELRKYYGWKLVNASSPEEEAEYHIYLSIVHSMRTDPKGNWSDINRELGYAAERLELAHQLPINNLYKILATYVLASRVVQACGGLSIKNRQQQFDSPKYDQLDRIIIRQLGDNIASFFRAMGHRTKGYFGAKQEEFPRFLFLAGSGLACSSRGYDKFIQSFVTEGSSLYSRIKVVPIKIEYSK